MFHLPLKKSIIKDKEEHEFGKDPNNDLQILLYECKQSLKSCNERQITKAFHWCVNAHKNKVRKSGRPYYTHPVEVARIIINEIPLDEVSVISALLHDVLDYSDIYTIKNIRSEFGSTVSDIVEGIAKIEHIQSRSIDDSIQIENYHRLFLSLLKDFRIIIIKLADRLHNMRTLEYLQKKRQKVTGFCVEARGTRALEHPRKYVAIELEFVVRGTDISPQAVERSIELSQSEYCGVTASLCAPVTYRYRIEDEMAKAE